MIFIGSFGKKHPATPAVIDGHNKIIYDVLCLSRFFLKE